MLKKIKFLYFNCKVFVFNYCYFKIQKKNLFRYMNKMLYFYLGIKNFIVEDEILDLIIKNVNFFSLNKQRFFFKPLVIGFKTKNFIFDGYVIKKPYYYAGTEIQPKILIKPKIIMMRNDLEFSKDFFFSIVIKKFNKFQKKFNKKWIVFYQCLNIIFSSDCSIVISTGNIGDLAAQFFSDHNIISVGKIDYSEYCVLELMLDVFRNNIIILEKILKFGYCNYIEEIELNHVKYIFFIGTKTSNIKTVLYYSDYMVDKTYLEKIFMLMKYFFKITLSNNCLFPSNFVPEIYLSYKLQKIKIFDNKNNLINHAIGRALETYIKLKINNRIINSNLLLGFWYLFQNKLCNNRINFILNFDFLEFVSISRCIFWEPCYIFFNLLKNTLEFLKFLLMIYF
uniref:T-complex protein1 eta SU n=1 Tax=Lotharella vacuolata TaxID=74820 RepID=A0A0H5BKW7_9EUKA|nr:t-complex protein1 eta SU [Lotharella vacuolata]